MSSGIEEEGQKQLPEEEETRGKGGEGGNAKTKQTSVGHQVTSIHHVTSIMKH